MPPWPNQKPTSVPAKGCDLVWAYLEELIQLHETPTKGIEHNELGWWAKKKHLRVSNISSLLRFGRTFNNSGLKSSPKWARDD